MSADSEFPRWCPECSRQVGELCHHLNCALKRSDEIDRLRSENERLQRRIDLECDSYAKEAREAEMAGLRAANEGMRKALEAAKDCINDLGSGKGGWAWEEVAQQIDAVLQGDQQ